MLTPCLKNPRDPHKVKFAYSEDSIWRNRDTFLVGRDAIAEFLTQKWQREKDYRLRKELFAFTDDRIAVQFWYEWHDDAGQWCKQHLALPSYPYHDRLFRGIADS